MIDKELIEGRISQTNAKYKAYSEIALLLANDIKGIVEKELGGKWEADICYCEMLQISCVTSGELSLKEYNKFRSKVWDFEKKLKELFNFGELCLGLKG